jgi:hypothetical protein
MEKRGDVAANPGALSAAFEAGKQLVSEQAP